MAHMHFNRHVTGQTPLGVFTNLWPTRLNRIDRRDGWYLIVHVGSWRLSVLESMKGGR